VNALSEGVDGVLLRRYGGSYSAVGEKTWKYRAWETVGWWTGETRPTEAMRPFPDHPEHS
jgi:hypothetical protein